MISLCRNSSERTIGWRPLGASIQVIAILVALLVSGCGSQEATQTADDSGSAPAGPAETATEAPESPDEPLSTVEPQSTGESQSTGQSQSSSPLVLPPGQIPGPSENETPAAQGGGFELPEDVAVPDASNDASPGKIDVQYASWDEIRSSAASTGRVTVVDLWSLACEPCLKEFPGLVRLHREMGQKVQCIAVDLDFDGRKSRPPEYYEEQVVAFLQSVEAAGFPTYICNTASDDVFAAAKLPSIPAVLVFDADGKLAEVFVDAGETAGFSYEADIVPAVEKLAG